MKKLFTNNIIGKILHLLKKENPKGLTQISFLTIMIGLFDLFTFGALIPVIYLINDPSPVFENKLFFSLYSFLGIKSVDLFIFVIILLLSVLFILKNTASLYIRNQQIKYAFSISKIILPKQFNNLFSYNEDKKKEINSINFLRYAATAPTELASIIILPFLILMYDGFILLTIISALILYSPIILILVCLTLFPFAYLLVWVTKKKLHHFSKIFEKSEIKSYQKALEIIKGYREIIAFNKKDIFVNKVKDIFSSLYDANRTVMVFQEIPRRIFEIIIILAIAVIFFITSIIFEYSKNELFILLIAFSTSAYRILPSLNEFLANYMKIKSSDYVFNYLSSIPEEDKHPVPPINSFENKIIIEDISYSYNDDNLILKNIDHHIEKGQFVIITGESGVGKTTFIDIIAGFTRPISGRIYMDNIELKTYRQTIELVYYIPQNIYLFDGNIQENIAIGETPDQIDQDKYFKSIEYAGLSNLINQKDNKSNFRIGENGSLLSGGQRQRIAIARALYKGAQIIIMDEITSSLDVENEKEILNTIYKLSKKENLTVILITHRLSSITFEPDQLLKVENGQVITLDGLGS